MNLYEYLKNNGITCRAFAKTIGTHELTVQRIKRREHQPTALTASKIVTATKGAVTLDDLLGESPRTGTDG